MDITRDFILSRLAETAAHALRHPAYRETVDVSKQAVKLMTRDGDDQYKEVTSFRMRETEQEKKQRIKLYNPLTAAALAPVYAYASEIKRVDGIKTHVEVSSDTISQTVNGKLSSYYHNESLFEFVFEACLHYNKFDPNGWLVFSQDVKPDRTVELYPTMVSSSSAIDYYRDYRGQLRYLTTLDTHQHRAVIADQLQKKTQDEYFLYAAGYVGHLIEQVETAFDATDYSSYEAVQIKDKSYYLQVFENPTLQTPAIQLGAYWHSSKQYYELMIAEAEPILRDLIRDKSYLDTNKGVQTFPRRREYTKRCDFVDDEGRECHDGRLDGEYGDEHKCPKCSGTGKTMVNSEQAVLTLPWPKANEEFADLTKISHTELADITLPTFLRSEVDWAAKAVFRAVYNQETVDKTMTVQTATEIKIEYDKIYNKLDPFSRLVARAVSLGIVTAYQYHGATDASASIQFPLDYKMKSVSELIAEYGEARTNGLPFYVLDSIEADLVAKQYRNAPDKLRLIQAINAWQPWRDKTPEEIAVILPNRADNDFQKILWENWAEITSEIRREIPNFGEAPAERQKQILENKVEEYTARIRYRVTEPLDNQLFT